jgi:hypothetical protein
LSPDRSGASLSASRYSPFERRSTFTVPPNDARSDARSDSGSESYSMGDELSAPPPRLKR